LRAERELGVAKKAVEFELTGIITLTQETLEEFGIWPVTHKEDRGR
jgi:hypothetical protein